MEKSFNALAREKSPYLRQHASNPVHWLPWGDDAFRRAREEGKPVLLSIGYAACHWCHVMARESFSDADTAELMNKHFINIKVDREERPDVDAIYLRALQAMGKRPGWPLTMFLTPTGKPFWGGTYFPPEQRYGQPGFRDVLARISETYQYDPAAAEASAAEVIGAIVSTREHEARKELGVKQVAEAADGLLRDTDKENGGLRGTPKFPYPALLRFMWNEGRRARRKDLQGATEFTLDCMIRGGIFDHVGGGFFRYATDAEWLFPHFEKMLYDNALLVHLLTEVWRGNRLDTYRDAVRRTVSWLLREMTLPGGAFACSLDAESNGEEGGFYAWNEQEIDDLLGPNAALFKQVYGVTREGNFDGRNVLNRLSNANLKDADEALLARSRAVLLQARSQRIRPRRDEKVLADWNGLAVAGLAKAAATFNEPPWLDAATAAFEFVRRNMIKQRNLYHSWCNGDLNTASILDDYADMSWAALSLYEATGRYEYLEYCTEWVERCTTHFCDTTGGAYYFTPDGTTSLVARIRDGNDAATPSGNGIMAHVLARLYFLTGKDRFRRQAQATVLAFTADIERDSYQLATLLDASRFLASAVQIVIVGEPDDETTRALYEAVHRHPGPDNVLMLVGPGTALTPQHPAVGKLAPAQRSAAYICAGTTCSAPAFDARGVREALDAAMVDT
jgi:uncharacterized protein YyaL (SSP411 family)